MVIVASRMEIKPVSVRTKAQTWSEPIILSGDGAGFDLGYPSTVQLEDGSLVTVWYEKFAKNPRAQLRQAVVEACLEKPARLTTRYQT